MAAPFYVHFIFIAPEASGGTYAECFPLRVLLEYMNIIPIPAKEAARRDIQTV